MPKQKRTEKIRRYILENVSEHPAEIVSKTVSAFGISRQAAHRHVKMLVSEGLLTASGRTRSRTYELKTLSEEHVGLRISPDMSEDRIWREKVRPIFGAWVKDMEVLRIVSIFERHKTTRVSLAEQVEDKPVPELLTV